MRTINIFELKGGEKVESVLELQKLNEDPEVETAGWWFTSVTLLVTTSTISNHC